MNFNDVALFRGLNQDVLAKIHSLAEEREFQAGEQIFAEDEPAVDLYILSEGRVELSYTLPNDPETDFRIAEVSPGQVFAWSALAKGETLSAKACALVPSSAYIIPAKPLHDIFHQHTDAGYEVMTRLSQQILARLRQTRLDLRWTHVAAR